MKTALFYEKIENGNVRCLLCPHNCTIKEGQRGTCGVRINRGGILYSETYERISSLNYDPIEKKPLYHFHPGRGILSIGSVGCNLKCSFCQNCSISQATVDTFDWFKNYSAADVVGMAYGKAGNLGIAFTYNEPTVFYEYMLEIAQLAKSRKLMTVMVSNGYINPGPLESLIPFMDAFNIDLKAFRNDFYKKYSKASLDPVLETLRLLKKHDKHVEITNLVIPGLNDDADVFREMTGWIHDELGKDSILHISRYFPHHRMTIGSTPSSTMIKMFETAKEKLEYVYLGNFASMEGQNTYCPGCGNLLISRTGYHTSVPGLVGSGSCQKCGYRISSLVI